MTTRFRTLAVLGAVATAAITALLPTAAQAEPVGEFYLRCTAPSGTYLGDLTLTYRYPRTVGKNIVQTYDTILFEPASSTFTKARGTMSMTLLDKPYTKKSFTVAANRTSRLNWKITVNEMKAYSARFQASVALTGRGAITTSGTCTNN
jgi:hypothetical protein